MHADRDAARRRRSRWPRSCSVALSLIMASSTAPVLAFSDVQTSASSVAGDFDGLGKAHADSKGEGSDGRPGSGWRWDFGHPRNDSSWPDDDEIVPATCGYYARSKRGCSKPRSCRDCLEMDGCMVNQFGACINMTKDGYEPALDYHKAFEFNLTGSGATASNQTLRYHFPAKNATYCPVGDATCLECKKTVFAGDVSDSRFCVGANDCICIASCEATGWEALAGGMRCGPPPRPKMFSAKEPPPPPKDGDANNQSGGVNWRDVWTMGGIPALVVVVGILVVRSHRLESRRREEALQQQQANSGGENGGSNGGSAETTAAASRPGRLNLPGWQSLRRNQIKKENLLLDGAQVSPKHHFVDLLDTQPGVNPEVTVLAAPVMGARVVEASAPPMSPQHEDSDVEPSAPSFDSDFEFEQEEVNMV